MNLSLNSLPIPPHFEASLLETVWRVPYQQRAQDANRWAKQYQIELADQDQTRVCLLLIDVQNTFCLPEFELYVGGQSGQGAIEDNIRLCEFIYRNLGVITQIIVTLDTHFAMQIFHPFFWINSQGEHPNVVTIIEYDDVKQGIWQINPAVANYLPGWSQEHLHQYALHYTHKLSEGGKYPLTIWPYHSMLGGIGHALVSGVEEAVFFHAIARNSQTHIELKGNNPLTENYSVLQPEVLESFDQNLITQKNIALIEKILSFDKILIAGQAKSHCVAWTVEDLLREIELRNPQVAQNIYLLEDCTSPVVVPGMIDYTEQANTAFQRFADAGMHRIHSIDSF